VSESLLNFLLPDAMLAWYILSSSNCLSKLSIK